MSRYRQTRLTPAEGGKFAKPVGAPVPASVADVFADTAREVMATVRLAHPAIKFVDRFYFDTGRDVQWRISRDDEGVVTRLAVIALPPLAVPTPGRTRAYVDEIKEAIKRGGPIAHDAMIVHDTVINRLREYLDTTPSVTRHPPANPCNEVALKEPPTYANTPAMLPKIGDIVRQCEDDKTTRLEVQGVFSSGRIQIEGRSYDPTGFLLMLRPWADRPVTPKPPHGRYACGVVCPAVGDRVRRADMPGGPGNPLIRVDHVSPDGYHVMLEDSTKHELTAGLALVSRPARSKRSVY